MRHAKQTDSNEKEIVDYLKKHGCQVERIGEPLDLLVGYEHRWVLVEVKPSLTDCIQRGQLEFLSKAKAQTWVVVNPEEAWKFVQSPGYGVCGTDQGKIAEWLIRNPEQTKLSVNQFRKLLEV